MDGNEPASRSGGRVTGAPRLPLFSGDIKSEPASMGQNKQVVLMGTRLGQTEQCN